MSAALWAQLAAAAAWDSEGAAAAAAAEPPAAITDLVWLHPPRDLFFLLAPRALTPAQREAPGPGSGPGPGPRIQTIPSR